MKSLKFKHHLLFLLVVCSLFPCAVMASTLFESLGIQDEHLQEKPSVATPKKQLGWLDKMRYESCQQDAAKAPTPEGVRVGLRICREKFKQ